MLKVSVHIKNLQRGFLKSALFMFLFIQQCQQLCLKHFAVQLLNNTAHQSSSAKS